MRNPEIPPTEHAPTQEDWERMRGEYERLRLKSEEYREQYQAARHYDHIIRNLLASCDACFLSMNNEKRGPRSYKNLQYCLQVARDYLELLQRYPDFRNSENTKLDGYFPEITKGYVVLERKAREEQWRKYKKEGIAPESGIFGLKIDGVDIGQHDYYVRESKKRLESQDKKTPDKSQIRNPVSN